MTAKNSASTAIILTEVSKQFPKASQPALNKISAEFKQGFVTGLVGPDGAGKTTLMRIIAGLLTRTEGSIEVVGLDPITDAHELRECLGYMPQKFGLYEDLTVLENLVLYADLRGLSAEERIDEFDRLLKFTDLKRFTARAAGNLSGGMKQKLGLACTLLGHPKVLLLDEPSVGVDPVSRRELWAMVQTLVHEGIAVVWSTSYLDEAELCDEVLLMNEGNLLYAGSPQALTNKLIGRSIQVQNIEGDRRTILHHALHTPEVMDGVIQGANVRLLLKEPNKQPDLELLKAGPYAQITAVPPRFEDAFIDLLGGVPGQGESPLAQIMQPIKVTTDSETAIEAYRLTKRYGDFTATDTISFAIKRGELFGLLGPNGAGKSTTFKMMCGLLTPTSGTATVAGLDLHHQGSQARQQIGYMAQKFSLYGDLTVQQNLEFFSGIYGLRGLVQTEKILQMIDAFELHPFLQSKAGELPLGFKQRLALACAIIHEPSILFLDEPTSGVDPLSRREFWTHINGLVAKGVTVMVTTHYMDEAEYCDRIGLIYRGTLIATGTPDQLKQLASNQQLPEPSMEDAFIGLVTQHDAEVQPAHQTTTEPLTSDFNKLTMNFSTASPAVRRWAALCRKEFYQIIRDPSSILIAFILPILMLFIYGYGINLDTSKIRLGLLLNDSSPEALNFKIAFSNSPYIQAIPMNNFPEASKALTSGKVRGLVIIQPDFARRLQQKSGVAPVQVITDGSEPNTAQFVTAYAMGAWAIWVQQRALEMGKVVSNKINVVNRYWFNPAAISRDFLIPGSIVLIMTVIGVLLTSLVVAREWERGTMEALLSTPITRLEFLSSKFFPYYLLGIISMTVCTVTAVTLLDTPFRGSIIALFIETSLFLASALGLGLLLSTVTRNQFNAAQAALNLAYLPALMLSGFIYEISSMPPVVQAITYMLPARYFVSALQTLFLAGTITVLLVENGLFLLISGLIFLGWTYKSTSRRLD